MRCRGRSGENVCERILNKINHNYCLDTHTLSLCSTNSAMSGGISFRQALNLRLNIIKPSVHHVEKLRERYTEEMDQILTPGIR